VTVRIRPAELQGRRLRRGHTTTSLAESSGVSQQRISALEQDAVPVRPTTAAALARALDCDVADITDVLDATSTVDLPLPGEVPTGPEHDGPCPAHPSDLLA
jgi:transcriptional regulator with XRE-family HTH domain